jgi:hypothetical protein
MDRGQNGCRNSTHLRGRARRRARPSWPARLHCPGCSPAAPARIAGCRAPPSPCSAASAPPAYRIPPTTSHHSSHPRAPVPDLLFSDLHAYEHLLHPEDFAQLQFLYINGWSGFVLCTVLHLARQVDPGLPLAILMHSILKPVISICAVLHSICHLHGSQKWDISDLLLCMADN